MTESMPTSDDLMLQMSPWDFDQTLNGGWRIYEDSDPLRAAQLIQKYIVQNRERILNPKEGEREIELRVMYFHIGQNLLFAGQEHYLEAIGALKQSFEEGHECWNAYVSATIGFLENDIQRIDGAINTIEQSQEYKEDSRSGNLHIVKNFKKALKSGEYDYKEVYLKKEIKQVGDYVSVNEQGYLVNNLKLESIQEKWKPVVEDVINEFKKHFGDKLIAVYVRGSVAAGRAVDGISDVDDTAIVDLPEDQIDVSWRQDFHKAMKEKYPFVYALEGNVDSFDSIKKSANHGLFLKTQSLRVYGQDLASELPEFELGRNTVAHAFSIKKNIDAAQQFILEQKDNPERIKRRCTVIMKRIVRSGFELVMERSHKYTRDLYLCWQEFSKYYPEKSDIMKKVMELGIYPTSDVSEIQEVLGDLGPWLDEEVKKVFPK